MLPGAMARNYIRLLAAYILDWIVIVAVAAGGGVLTYINGYHRPFSLSDPAIAYPDKEDIVSVPVVVIVALIVPAGIIAVACLIEVIPSRSRRSQIWSSYIWHVNAGWMGLCTGLAVTLFTVAGLKDVVGKPRPNMLARCQPDLTNITAYLVGGLGNSLNSEASPIVSSAICRQPNTRLLDDAFAAFPSGHSSFSSAGLVYLSLWLFARFSIGIPSMNRSDTKPMQKTYDEGWLSASQLQQAAPPSWQMAIAFAPVLGALFICASRYADFHHAGFDIIAGAVIGSLFGWASFRIYHMPMRRSGGALAWGPRAGSRAFFYGPYNDKSGVVRTEDAFARGSNYEMDNNLHMRAGRVSTTDSAEPMVRGHRNIRTDEIMR